MDGVLKRAVDVPFEPVPRSQPEIHRMSHNLCSTAPDYLRFLHHAAGIAGAAMPVRQPGLASAVRTTGSTLPPISLPFVEGQLHSDLRGS